MAEAISRPGLDSRRAEFRGLLVRSGRGKKEGSAVNIEIVPGVIMR